MSETGILDLQADMVGRALADEYLGAVPILDERRGSIVDDIQVSLGLLTAVSGKLGACIIVLSPVGKVQYPDAPWGEMEQKITFRVLENPTLNNDASTGTLKPALGLVRRLVRVFHHYIPVALSQCLVAEGYVPVEDALAPVAYEVTFTTVESDPATYPKVATPTIAPSGGVVPQLVTLACATAGAAMYYTLDGTHPRVGNGTLYAAPFNVNAAARLRVAAFKAGSLGSDVNSVKFD